MKLMLPGAPSVNHWEPPRDGRWVGRQAIRPFERRSHVKSISSNGFHFLEQFIPQPVGLKIFNRRNEPLGTEVFGRRWQSGG